MFCQHTLSSRSHTLWDSVWVWWQRTIEGERVKSKDAKTGKGEVEEEVEEEEQEQEQEEEEEQEEDVRRWEDRKKEKERKKERRKERKWESERPFRENNQI